MFATFARLSKFAMELLSKSLGVSLPIVDGVVYSMVAMGCLLVICIHVLEADHMVFNLLKMDWLS